MKIQFIQKPTDMYIYQKNPLESYRYNRSCFWFQLRFWYYIHTYV